VLFNKSASDVCLQYDSKLFVCGPSVSFDIAEKYPGAPEAFLKDLFLSQTGGALVDYIPDLCVPVADKKQCAANELPSAQQPTAATAEQPKKGKRSK
jgi:hypothetical protein